jgi:3-phosphoshikimate 1-carboxyvinyltransferase
LLVASNLENGIELTLEGEITSVPYIKMTLALLNDLDIGFIGNKITVIQDKKWNKVMTVESD